MNSELVHPEEPVLRTPRLILRRVCAADRDEFVRVHELSRDLHDRWGPRSHMSIAEKFANDLERSEREWESHTGVRFIAHLSDGRHAAYVNLMQIVRFAFQSCVIGWRSNVQVLNQGYCTEAVTAALAYAFTPAPAGQGLHRVQAAIIPDNHPSLRVAEKCGFRREGLAIRYLQINGEWRDHALFAKLSDEHPVPSQDSPGKG